MSRHNIVLICLDTVRKDYFDEFATRLQSRSETSFSECRAASSWTVPSHASMFTGTLPHRHGVHSHNIDFSDIHRSDTFIDELPLRRTMGVSANPYASLNFGFGELFDKFHDVTPSVPFSEGMYLKDFESEQKGLLQNIDYASQALDHDYPTRSLLNGINHVLKDLKPDFFPRFGDDGGAAVSRMASQLAKETKEPFFLFLNFMDAHGPFASSIRYDKSLYSVPATWSSNQIDIWDFNRRNNESPTGAVKHYRDLYAASVDYLDRVVSKLVDDLQSITNLETMVLITADHGENLSYPGEDGLLEHKSSLSEGVLHVPFEVINSPTSLKTNPEQYFTHLDLGNFIIDIATDIARNYERECLPAEVVGVGPARKNMKETDARYWDRMIRAAYNCDQKFVWDTEGHHMEYAVGDEPCRQRQVADGVDIPFWATDLFQEDLSDYKSRQLEAGGQIVIDGSTTGRLEDLGYL